jgi:hypothetical protein
MTASVVEATSPLELTDATATQTISTIAPLNLESYVRAYFAKTPVLAQVAKCESRFRQFDKNGQVLRGLAVREDVGIMQVNEYYHKDVSTKLGFDIYTLDGNLAYAKWLYDREGTAPWSASKACWGN